ncbi:MAG: sporulation protein [Sedimentibacter sp.]|nr:sporulation protein [Sedimentibacter sp.]
MSENFSINDNINNIFARLEEFIKTKTVVGEQIQIGEITIIPFIDVTFGAGTGGGSGTEKQGSNGTGGGSGSAGKISPTAILVIKGDKVELLPIKKSANLEKLIDLVPELVDKIKVDNNNESVKE